MAWVKQKKNEHVCKKPELDGLVQPDPGDIWQCDNCGLYWRVHEHQIDGLYWMSCTSTSWL